MSVALMATFHRDCRAFSLLFFETCKFNTKLHICVSTSVAATLKIFIFVDALFLRSLKKEQNLNQREKAFLQNQRKM